MTKLKKGQEEIVGFALIIILVSIILLVFLSISLRSSSAMEIQSYEAEGFIQAVLQHTSECKGTSEYLSVQKLIFSEREETCSDERSAREILNLTLIELCEKGWNVGENTPIKGYEMRLLSDGTEFLSVQKGNITQNYKGAMQDFSKRGIDYGVYFKVYYD